MLKKHIKKLDLIWSAEVKKEAGYRCELCGKKSNECALQSHHYYGRRHRSLRWDIQNGICLCYVHHKGGLQSAHESPEWFRGQMIDLRGHNWLKYLQKQANKCYKGTYETVKDYLENKTKKYV